MENYKEMALGTRDVSDYLWNFGKDSMMLGNIHGKRKLQALLQHEKNHDKIIK